MSASFRYPLREKVLFYLDYFVRKAFCLWFEVKRPRLRMFVYEMIYSARKLFDYRSTFVSPFDTDLVETVFGRFRIRRGTADMSNVSPAFERRDLGRLLGILDGLRKEGKRVLFADIGADLGTFAVSVGNRFRDYAGLRVMAFEPASSSFRLLEENIRLNGLDGKAELYGCAIYGEDGLELEFTFSPVSPGWSSLARGGAGGTEKVYTRKLDSVLSGRMDEFDAIVMKIDVEGAECEVIKGARDALSSALEIYLMVEDFVNPEVVACLESAGAEFVEKLTPYNSFWHLGRSASISAQ